MGILVGLRLQVTYRRQVSGIQRVEEIVRVILMISRVTRHSNRRRTGGAGVGWIARAGVILKRLMMLNVIGLGQSRDRRNRAPFAQSGSVGVGRREIEPSLEPSPGKSRGVEQIAYIFSAEADLKRSRAGTHVHEGISITDKRKAALAVGDFVAGWPVQGRGDSVGLSRNQIDGARRRGSKLRVVGVIAQREVLRILPHGG